MKTARTICVRVFRDWPGLALCLVALVLAGHGALPLEAAVTTNSLMTRTVSTDYVGSSICRECHQKFYELWAPSHHGLAMQPFTAELARTQLTPHTGEIKIGTNSYRADLDHREVVERSPSGEKRFSIAHSMGGKNVFYFLAPLEKGRLQVLPVAYDVNRKEWYDTASSAIRHFDAHLDEALDWRDPAFTFNTSCYSCHVSQLARNYDLATDTYHTSWREPGINCETCHGGAEEHVRAARALPKGQPMKDPKIIVNQTFTPDQINSTCGSCHAKLVVLTGNYQPGDRFFDHFGLVTLEHSDFYADGRDLGENFTMTTWRMSPCAKAGQLHCVTCHTSSGRYRFKEPAKANEACLPCHEHNVKHVAAHSRHQPGTAGAQCISCHMPMTEFARMRRSDHSMRPPMPAATKLHGSPNACNICHTNKDSAWADQEVRRWHQRDFQAPALHRASLVASARKRDWSKLPEILKYLENPTRDEIWASSLIQLLRPCEDPSKWPALKECLKDTSPLVRAAAVEALGDRLQPGLVAPLLTAARDDYRLVRVRAASALSALPREGLNEADQKTLGAATEELLASLRVRPDDTTAHYNLGNLHLEWREHARAVEEFQTAIRLQPNNLLPLVNISLAYNALGQNDKADASLRQARRLDPTNAVVNLNHGMLLAEMNRLAEAEQAFRTAFKSNPQCAQAAFNLGVLLANDHPEEALEWCRRAVALRPHEPRYAYTLAFYLHRQGHQGEAAQTLEKLLQHSPNDADSYALLTQVYLEQNQKTEALAVCRRAMANANLTAPQRQYFQSRIRALEQ